MSNSSKPKSPASPSSSKSKFLTPQDPEDQALATEIIPLAKPPVAPKRKAFPRIAEVREMLKARGGELISLQLRIIYEAIANQDYETANDANQFLLKHLPPDESGVRVIDPDIDRPKDSGKTGGPSIQIGFALGGLPQVKQLPAPEVIETSEELPGRSTPDPTTKLDDGTGSEGSLMDSRRESPDT